MRTPRIVILGAFFFTTITLTFLVIHASHAESNYGARRSDYGRGGMHNVFSFHTPLSLFPPNAIISLTDDNTTSFLARPAAFGPLLPAKGLSGQLWIGSGFGDDGLQQGAIVAGAEGELGCSDVVADGHKNAASSSVRYKHAAAKAVTSGAKSANQRRTGGGTVPDVDRTSLSRFHKAERVGDSDVVKNDGTDDYLHASLPVSSVSKPSFSDQETDDVSSSQTEHADIQSIQEGAEIAGKIVLLSRGGCGFLQKVMWVQRRGGVALIVGDDTKGGPLIQMYANGDTSNVTIPSLFTSHTTAHLLSSLIPPGSYIEDSIDENGRATMKVHQSKQPKKSRKKASKHSSLPTNVAGKSVATSRPGAKATNIKKPLSDEVSAGQGGGWWSYLFSGAKTASDNKAASSSGRLDWVLVDEWDDTENSSKKASPKSKAPKSQKDRSGSPASSDDFVIGVQDWRDPDLVGSPASAKISHDDNAAAKVQKKGPRPTSAAGKTQPDKPSPDKSKKLKGFEGGSITPGSGEYKDGFPAAKIDTSKNEGQGEGDPSTDKDKSGLLAKLFGDDEDESEVAPDLVSAKQQLKNVKTEQEDEEDEDEDGADGPPDHQGLWLTLTPTSGATPFFDTLLVLVVSPLVTLTVVYALLLLRSRLRRRRWRAPKSVVERLPVRTYQTLASSSSTSTSSMSSSTMAHSRVPAEGPGLAGPCTPLLQSSSTIGGVVARPRPRSRTTSGLPEPGLLSRTNSGEREQREQPRTPSRGRRNNEQEKFEAAGGGTGTGTGTGTVTVTGTGRSSEWTKYMGKQVECVVCLEEYVDGISRVMSLPCGHEFHVDCITPWLTTRRRTCPICKGDVVRSLARSSPSAAAGAGLRSYGGDYRDGEGESEDGDWMQEGVERRSGAVDIPRDVGMTGSAVEEDLERGVVETDGLLSGVGSSSGRGGGSSWRAVLVRSLGSASLSRSPRPTGLGQEDRSR